LAETIGTPEGKRPLGGRMCRWENNINNIKMDFELVG
jgi:hypothetical protein